MLRVALRSILNRFGRVLLGAIAVVVSTAFLSGTLIFTDTIQGAFDALFAEVYDDVDGYVQSSNSVENDFGFEQRDRLPIELVDAVARVPGVVDAQRFVQGVAVIIGADGDRVGTRGALSFGGTINSGELTVWDIIDGHVPEGGGEVVLDADSAEHGKYAVGDEVKVTAEGGSRTFELVGIAKYSGVSSPGGATFALFDDDTASDFVAKRGFIDAVLVKGDGSVSDDELADRVRAVLPADAEAEVLTGAEITEQSQSAIEDALSFLRIFLTVFSGIALAVGCFVIYNVFSITAAQRQRETALLRAIGASRRQVTSTLLIEAVVVALVGSVLGLVAGIGLALGIRSMLDAAGFGAPVGSLVVLAGTVATTVVAGLLATLLAAVLPAIRSGRVPPVAAMRDTALERVDSPRGRVITALGLSAIGVASILGVVAGADTRLLTIGVVGVFSGVLVLGPILARPVATVLGAPVQRIRGVPGAMARGNVLRNPKRTARTAAPVLIGVALVTGATVFAASLKSQIRDTIGDQFHGDFTVTADNNLGFSPKLVDELNALPEVDVASGFGFAFAVLDGTSRGVLTIDPSTAGSFFDFDFAQGSLAALTRTGILVTAGKAERDHLQLGSTIDARIGGVDAALTVEGVYRADELASGSIVNRELFVDSSAPSLDHLISVSIAPDSTESATRAALERVIGQFGLGKVQDRDEFIDSQADLVNKALTLVYGLLALSIVIAIFGIVLTLLLSIYERRRETGLLRAVGMNRRQVRSTVRWESVITSLYGAVVGVVLGLVMGYVVVLALRDQGFERYTIPVTSVVVILVIAFIVGVLAAVIPARRATKVDVLEAIAST